VAVSEPTRLSDLAVQAGLGKILNTSGSVEVVARAKIWPAAAGSPLISWRIRLWLSSGVMLEASREALVRR